MTKRRLERIVKVIMKVAVVAIVGLAILTETVAPEFPLWPGMVLAVIWLVAFGLDTTL